MQPKYAHELAAGEHYAPLEYTVTHELNQQFLYAVEDFDRVYIEGIDARGPLVHPVLLLHMMPRTRSPSYRQAPGMGSAFARDKTWFLHPAFVGELLRVSWTVSATYEQRGKIYQDYVAVTANAAGTAILRRELSSTFFTLGKVKTFALDAGR
ncbi:MAG: hypothetical protein IT531_10830 [Burkholderiales bacterium]|nr:hypothetical protein [Burkholderiales bacterium]